MKRFDRYYNKSLPQEVFNFICDSEKNHRSVEEFIIRLSSLNFDIDIDNFILLLSKSFSPWQKYYMPSILIDVVKETNEFDFIKDEDNVNILKEFIHYNVRSGISVSSKIFELLKTIDNKYETRFQHFLSTEILALDNIKFSKYKSDMIYWINNCDGKYR